MRMIDEAVHTISAMLQGKGLWRHRWSGEAIPGPQLLTSLFLPNTLQFRCQPSKI